MTDETKVKMNPYIPMRNPVDVATIGKLQEELGELQAILARCLIQGIHEEDPRTEVLNKDALQNEVSDVMTGLEMLARRFSLDRHGMNQRISVKVARMVEWHGFIEKEVEPVKPPEPTPPARKSWWVR